MLLFTDAGILRCFPLVSFMRIFLKENDVNILISISLKFVPGCSVNNLPTLVEIMAWRRSGDKPLSKRGIPRENENWIKILAHPPPPPSAAYMHQRIGWALFQILTSRLFSAKPLPKRMMTYCQLEHKEETSVKFEPKYEVFNSCKRIWKDRLRNGGHFVQSWGGWVNIFTEGCDILMFILVIIRIGGSHSDCDFHSLTHLCCDKMAVVLHMIFSNAFLEWKMRLIFLCELHRSSFRLECVSIGLNNGMVPV